MAWDDSDEEVEEIDFEKQLAEKKKEEERKKRRDEGLDSESDKEAAPAPKAGEKPKPKPKAKAVAKEEEKPMTAQERKLLQRKAEEEQSARMAGDLFSGCDLADEAKEAAAAKKKEEEDKKKEAAASKQQFIIVDAFEKVELKVQKDVDGMLTDCLDKINKGSAKGAASFFCTNILKQLEPDLNDEELASVDQAITEILKAKNEQTAVMLTVEKKAVTKVNKNTKFNTHSEWEDIYGGGAGDEAWTQEEWDAWQKEQQEGGGGGTAPAKASGAKW